LHDRKAIGGGMSDIGRPVIRVTLVQPVKTYNQYGKLGKYILNSSFT